MALTIKKASPSIPAPLPLQVTFRNLAEAATELNKNSDQLTAPIRVCEEALKKLNLGVSAWATISKGKDDHGFEWDRAVGYTQFKDYWGIALRERDAIDLLPAGGTETVWPFSEAPRWMRVNAVAHFPALFEALLKQVRDTNALIAKRAAEAAEFADAITRVANGTAFEDWRDKLIEAMKVSNLPFSADAMSESKAELLPEGLLVTTSKRFQLDLGQSEIKTALKALGCEDIPFRIQFGETKSQEGKQ